MKKKKAKDPKQPILEYDSDEETDGGTWEHKKRAEEMISTLGIIMCLSLANKLPSPRVVMDVPELLTTPVVRTTTTPFVRPPPFNTPVVRPTTPIVRPPVTHPCCETTTTTHSYETTHGD